MLNENIDSIVSFDKVDCNSSKDLDLTKILKKAQKKKNCLLLIVKVEDNNILALYRNLDNRWIVFGINDKFIYKDRSLFITENFLYFENQTLIYFDFEIFIIKLGQILFNNNISK